jgi:hypothetical protein
VADPKPGAGDWPLPREARECGHLNEQQSRTRLRRGATGRDGVAGLLPAGAVMLGLLVINKLRFGAWTEFGGTTR